jgi:peptidoglycan/LPS O-acetylase OafA/YrhL
VNGNPEFRKAWLLAIWGGLTTEPVWKYQELPPFLLPELIKLDLVEAGDSELSRVMWFWLRRPKPTLSESAALVIAALCALLSVTIAFVDLPLTAMTKRAAELMILLVGVAVLIYAVVHRSGFSVGDGSTS